MGMVELKSPDGKVSGYLAVPKAGSGPGLLVLHAWLVSSSSTGREMATTPRSERPFSDISLRRTNLKPPPSCKISRRSSAQPVGRTSRSTHILGQSTGFSRKTDLTRMMRRQPSSPGNERFDFCKPNCRERPGAAEIRILLVDIPAGEHPDRRHAVSSAWYVIVTSL